MDIIKPHIEKNTFRNLDNLKNRCLHVFKIIPTPNNNKHRKPDEIRIHYVTVFV